MPTTDVVPVVPVVPEEVINRFLLNRLNDVCTPDRFCCQIKDGKLYAYVGGGDKIIYNPATDTLDLQYIYYGYLHLKKYKLNKKIFKDIFDMLSNVKIEKTPDQILKEKYGITSKRVNGKIKKEIMKYEALKPKNILSD